MTALSGGYVTVTPRLVEDIRGNVRTPAFPNSERIKTKIFTKIKHYINKVYKQLIIISNSNDSINSIDLWAFVLVINLTLNLFNYQESQYE